MIECLDLEDLIQIADAACGRHAEVRGQDAYPTLLGKAAALLHSLTRTTRWSTETSDWHSRPQWYSSRSTTTS